MLLLEMLRCAKVRQVAREVSAPRETLARARHTIRGDVTIATQGQEKPAPVTLRAEIAIANHGKVVVESEKRLQRESEILGIQRYGMLRGEEIRLVRMLSHPAHQLRGARERVTRVVGKVDAVEMDAVIDANRANASKVIASKVIDNRASEAREEEISVALRLENRKEEVVIGEAVVGPKVDSPRASGMI